MLSGREMKSMKSHTCTQTLNVSVLWEPSMLQDPTRVLSSFMTHRRQTGCRGCVAEEEHSADGEAGSDPTLKAPVMLCCLGCRHALLGHQDAF